ncbi:hypothetical protein [Pseudomonas citronellolis]|uniref:hypothetical protein n=1 Tax=Pseudomonas citronellolis TaxID=53408 RepID=UPI0023E3D6DC|nr:hypothetical protein [Pseudomonas citronellolis]MDF3931322.1 hypothetical protein [Pseudomonas citronellolis]
MLRRTGSAARWPLGCLLLAALLALAACAGRHPAPVAPAPVTPATWEQVDRDLAAASMAASDKAEEYAQNAMESWMDLVYQRTDSDFIPWFSGYWTQQFLGIRVAWYKLGDSEKSPAVNRLAVYLQEQYQRRVLAPVAKQIDPDAVMESATRYYLQNLAGEVDAMPERLGVPRAQLDQRLQAIPVIALGPPPARDASLYQLLRARKPQELPAYQALIAQIHDTGARTGVDVESPDTGVSAVAKRTSEKLLNEVTVSGAVGAIASAVGKVAGAALSLASTGFTAFSRDRDRPQLEAQLRKDLNEAFDQHWLALMGNGQSGVLAGVHYMSTQVEAGVAGAGATPGGQ